MKGKSNMKVALCQINIEFENKEYNKKKIIALFFIVGGIIIYSVFG